GLLLAADRADDGGPHPARRTAALGGLGARPPARRRAGPARRRTSPTRSVPGGLMPTVTPSFRDVLPGWIGRQRWYTAKGRTPELRRVGGLRFEDPDGEVGIETWLLRDEAGPAPVVYQVPLTYRSAPAPELEHALLAQVEHSELGPRWVYDACHDPAGARALLAAIVTGEAVVSDGGAGLGRATGHRAGGPGAMRAHTAGESVRVLSGEQSNTSIIFEGEDGPPVICKVFRVVAEGRNPDVVVHEALADAGSTRVPA